MAGRKNAKSNWSIATVVVVVFVASLFVVFQAIPENVVVQSENGLVSVTGFTRSSSALMIDRIDGVAISVESVTSPVYQISFDGGGALTQGEIVMGMEGRDIDLSEVELYFFDANLLSWVALPTLFDLEATTVSSGIQFEDSLLIVAGMIVDE